MKKIEPMPWRGVSRGNNHSDPVAVAAAAVLALPFLDQVIIRRLARLPALRPVVIWLANGCGLDRRGNLGAPVLLFTPYIRSPPAP